ncbi:hypothetical protein [Hymenobacter jejuensis]|uniref:DUF2231 domain-containing protein n=1 Tax=Hymenobacter jejuensis TaxID=2502781 RepID=A0A5B8A275_9BACT|nr:hypothetical protein [Hymenobacter jejuensis]QDA61491.1 hypothetical protein FHG12_15905 [Hymenobacter jejuensis]
MNEAHIHLILNHTPILGSLFGLVLMLTGMIRQNAVVLRTGLVTLVVAAVLAMPTQLTGEGAEKVVEHQPGVSRSLLHEHEEAAELAFWVLSATGALALGSVLLLNHQHRRAALLARFALAGALLSFGLMARAGNLGGQIMHPETRSDFVSNAFENEHNASTKLP